MIGLITGANRGLGLELVKQCLENGHMVAATYQCSDEKLGALRYLKELFGEQLLLLKLDVTSEVIAAEAVKAFETRFQRLDFLVNNAGVLFESKYDKRDPLTDFDIDMFRKTLEVNTVGPAIVTKSFAPMLYLSQKAVIVNISSEAGHLSPGGHHYMAYSISKHGLNMYTQKLRNYLSQRNEGASVRIFMVHPGRMDTDMGKENAQIAPSEAAKGILSIIEGRINPKLDIPFIDYQGNLMPY